MDTSHRTDGSMWRGPRTVRVVLWLVGLLPVAAAWAQPAPVGAVSAPMLADTALRGSVIATMQAATPAECQSRCSATSGCTGWTFSAGNAGRLPSRGQFLPAPQASNCTLMSGALTQAAQAGAVACRMPCTATAAPAGGLRPLPGAMVLTPPQRQVIVPPPVAPPPPAMALPVTPMVSAGTLVVPTPPGTAASAPPAAPTQITRWRYARPEGGTVVVPGQVGSHVTACPDGRVATASANENLKRDINENFVTLGVVPTADGSGLIHKIENPVFSQASPAGAAAICIDRPAGYQRLRDARTLTPGQRVRLEVGCPAGQVVIGGGTQADPGIHTAVSSPSLDGSVWVGHFRSDAVFGTRNVEAFAVCAAAAAVPGRQVMTTARTQLRAGDNTDMKLVCPYPKKAVAVGVHADATTVKGWVQWMDPKLWDDPRNRITMAKETWRGIYGNSSAPIENVFIDLRMVLICANASF